MFALRYIPKKISEINSKTDSRIAIVGKVIEQGENSFVLEDDSGKVEIESEEEVELNKTVRVFCSLTENQLKADIVQSLNGFDLNLFNKVKELYNKAGV
ncbi:MAG: hypothetical protein QMD12_01820 [Candidatus Aenigmarchaeota archaeon]|nr:hypothetical protein [Candidatus Aenigmarchaeota archaeon]